MAKRLIMQRRGQYLAPADSESREAIAAMGFSEIVAVEIMRPRSLPLHRKFFAMVGEVFKNQSTFLDEDDLLDAVKIALGHRKEGYLRDGTLYYIPKSISFSKMDETKFQAFYNKFLDYCLEVIIPGVNKPDFEMHLLSIIDGRNYQEMRR